MGFPATQLMFGEITSDSYRRNPFPTLALWREHGPLVPVRHVFLGKVWLVTSHAAASELLRDRQTFVREPASAGFPRRSVLPWWLPREFQTLTRVMINRDEPEHRRLRKLVEQAFVRRSVTEMRPRIESLTARMLDELTQQSAGGKTVDLVAGLARPLPLVVIGELLGLPDRDRPMFMQVAGKLTGKTSWKSVFRLYGTVRWLIRYIREQIALCRAQPQPGLITELIAAEEQGDRLTEDEMVSMIIMLLLAGHVTTVHLIGGGLLTLLQHPEAAAEMRADETRIEPCVEELLRYLSPVQLTKPMLAARDLEWQGVRLQRGDRLMGFLAAANTDPHKFSHPDTFDWTRSPNPHLAFGAGIHHCLGKSLAMAEAEVAILQVLNRFPNLRMAVPEAQIVWSKHLGTRGLETLPVRLG